MEETHIKLSVVICTKDRSRLLEKCLKAVSGQCLSGEIFEVIVVDNASADDTQKVFNDFVTRSGVKNMRIVIETAPGHSQARNRGWREARGQYIAYVDDDALAVPEWAAGILFAFENISPAPAMVGGKIMPLYENAPPFWFLDEYEIRSWGERPGFLGKSSLKGGFSGANMAARRELLEKCGGFSEDYGIVDGKFRAGEDSDLCRRIFELDGNFWYDPGLIVYHWTPCKTMTVKNIFLRNYNSGVSTAFSQKKNMTLPGFLKTWLDFILKFLFLPFMLPYFSGRKPMMKKLVSVIEDIGFRLGYLMGEKG